MRSRSIGTALVFGGAIAYGVFACAHRTVAVGGSDTAGYACTARDIAAGTLVLPVEAPSRLGLDERLTMEFIPLAHELGPKPGTMVPYYPPGFPIHIALAATAFGWESAPFLVSPILAVLCLLLVYQLGRELGLSRPEAAAGALILGAWAVFVFHAIQPMSDMAATVWATAAVVAGLRARQTPGWALAAGAAFGLAVLVRPTNGLLLPALLLALPSTRRALVLFLSGAAPLAAFYGFWNRAAFGSPFRTGYTHQFQGELALENFPLRIRRYGAWLVAELSLVVPLGWLLAVAGVNRHVRRRDRALLGTWFGAIFGFYCFWGPSDNWTYGRYFLPAAPALVVGLLLAVRGLTARLSTPLRAAVASAVVAVVLAVEWRAVRSLGARGGGDRGAEFELGSRAAAKRAGRRPAIVVSMETSAALRYYTDLMPLRWDRISPEDFALVRARAGERGVPVYAFVFDREIPDALPRVPGSWVLLEKTRTGGLWALPAP
ncbi:MAG TPA: glycosyltransferase family 39 protein [Thermoanaerobaculia bacterium]|nr:glycosyltransferase family 39 protein [Thermoanaerobaculia bacterium]